MANAENGARIKAFAGDDVGSGTVQNITFQNFVVSNVDSPVVIDQVSLRFCLMKLRLIFTLNSATKRQQMTAKNFLPMSLSRIYFSTSTYVHLDSSLQYLIFFLDFSISGTGSGSQVASLDCSPGSRCTDINVNGFDLSSVFFHFFTRPLY